MAPAFLSGGVPAPVSRRRVATSGPAALRATCARPGAAPWASLVTAQWLQAALQSADPPAVIDVRGHVAKLGPPVDGHQKVRYVADGEAHFAGHVPSASFLDWRTVRTHPLDEFREAAAERGVSRTKPVCVYDGGSMLFATRVWFSLLAAGCDPRQTHVLQGGWKAWGAWDGPVDLDTVRPPKARVPFDGDGAEDGEGRVAAALPARCVDAAGVRSLLRRSPAAETVLVDARSAAQFAGRERRGRRAGRIPSAISVPYRTLLAADGVGFADDETLARRLREAGVLRQVGDHDPPRSVLAYCNGGVASTAVLFALARCGVPWDSMLQYDGSMNEWANLGDEYPVHVDVP
jgi:thiosulfate/3-mercaptopyruvate sulfurtransferase